MEKFYQLAANLNEQILSHPVTQALWSFYESRSAQERSIIRTGLMVLLALFIWFVLLLPLANFADNAQQKYEAAKADLQWMQTNRDQAKQAVAKSDQEIAQVVPASPIASYVSNLTPDEDDGATLVLNNAPFNLLVETLAKFSRENGIHVDTATIQRKADASGYVSATLKLSRN
jgi:type II secretory pathway component PulM